jgi:hypothetical protein
MRPIYLAISLFAACAVLPAQNQQNLGPRSFFPKEYTGEAYVNMAALVETDLWEEIERSLVSKPLLAAFLMQFGFRRTDLKDLRVGMDTRKMTYSGGHETYRQQPVTVFQGQRKLSLPKPKKQEWDHNRRTKDEIGGHKVVQEGIDTDENNWSQPMLWVIPKPGCLVYGDKTLIQPVLEGERRGGVPHPELMAFTVGRRPLAYYAVKLEHDEKYLRNAAPFPFGWYTADDKPTFMMLRMTVDEKTQISRAVLRLRFTDGSKGPDLFEAEVKASFKMLDTDRDLKRLAFLKKFTKKLVFKKQGADLEISCDLGDAKQAAELSALAQTLPLLLFAARAAPVRAAAPAAVIEEVEEEEPEEEEAKEAEAAEKKAVERAKKAAEEARKAAERARKEALEKAKKREKKQ